MSPNDPNLIHADDAPTDVENGCISNNNIGAVRSKDDDDEMKQQEESSEVTTLSIQATAEMCYYCFDVLIQELYINNNKNSLLNRAVTTTTTATTKRSSSFLFQPSSRSSSDTTTSAVTSSSVDDNNIAKQKEQQQQQQQQFVLQDTPLLFPSNEIVECPLFVTWEKEKQQQKHHLRKHNNNNNNNNEKNNNSNNYELRGCIGTLIPKKLTNTTLKEYAILSSLHDKRFTSITINEIPTLRVGVSLLINYEQCTNYLDWIVGIHGIIIKFFPYGNTLELSATFLPEVAVQQKWDQNKTIHALIRKAGYKGTITHNILQKLNVTKYQSSKYKISFIEYIEYINNNNNNNNNHYDWILSIIENNNNGSNNDNNNGSLSTSSSSCGIM